ncbi:MAG: sodium/substrate symporter small subunit [Pseudomonadota bacterium]
MSARTSADWLRTRTATLLFLLLWFLMLGLVPLLAGAADSSLISGFPEAVYDTAQGAILGFVVLAFVFCRVIRRVEGGVDAEEDR